LIQELNRRKTEEAPRKDNHEILLDESRGILIIGEHKIKIQKFSNQYYVLKVMLKDEENKNKDWQFSEIAEKMAGSIDISQPWKQLYHVASALKTKIAIETQIKDFFITTTQSIKINKRYLKES
jgi:hypothetical protein